MAFYKDKLDEYSLTRNPHRLPKQERLENALAKVKGAYKSSIDANEVLRFRTLNNGETSGAQKGVTPTEFQVNVLEDKITQDRAALEYLSTLTANDYFKLLAKKEEVELQEVIDANFEKMGAATEQLVKLENNQGLTSKFYSLTGKMEDKIEEVNAQFEQANAEAVVAQEALTEWKFGLQFKDKQEYLIERFEHEGLVSLDVQGLTNYIQEKDALMQPVSTEDVAQ